MIQVSMIQILAPAVFRIMCIHLFASLSRRRLSPSPKSLQSANFKALLFSLFTFVTGQMAWSASNSPTLAISIRTLSSPYQVMYKVGAEAYAKQVGSPLDVLTTEANSQKGLTDIKAEVARTGANEVFYIDPNDACDAVPIGKTIEAAVVCF